MEFLSSLFASSGDSFVSFFQNFTIIGLLLALIFGAFWLVFYKPPFFKHSWLWLILAGSVVLTLLFIPFVQVPLQIAVGKLFYANWTEEQLMRGILFTSLPTMLIAALVVEGLKLIPVAAYWWRKDKIVDPKFGLVIGAVAGAGFGILEAQSLHNALFAMGWSWGAIGSSGFTAILPFLERFFFIGFNIALTAVAGYGLAKGLGWQYYLIVSGVHGVMNYLTILFQMQFLTLELVEMFIGMIAVGSFIVSIWLLKRKEPATVKTVVKT